MAHNPLWRNSSLAKLGLGAIALGALLLLVVPALLLVWAFGGDPGAHLPGTLVILSAAAGMGLVVLGAVLYE